MVELLVKKLTKYITHYSVIAAHVRYNVTSAGNNKRIK